MPQKTFKFFFLYLFFLSLFFGVNLAEASSTQGIIDTTYKNAWGEKIGWINFGCANCSVSVTDTLLTGYLWSANYGWINLNPTSSGVVNNGNGVLSGSAWAKNLGWIDWSGVTINSEGRFTGQASGSVAGVLNFDCANCRVVTDWRPRNVRPACNNSIDDDGDGVVDFPGDLGCESYSDTDEVNQGVTIINISTSAVLVNEPTSNLTEEIIAKEESVKIKPVKIVDWPKIKEKAKTIIVEVFNPIPVELALQDFIRSRIPTPDISFEKLAKILNPIRADLFLPGFLKSRVPVANITLDKLVPKNAPDSLKNNWVLLPRKNIKEFVLAPLPKDIKKLAEKFPELNKTFNEIGISKITDLSRLTQVPLKLPGISKRASYGINLTSGTFFAPKGIPIAKLSPKMKQALPSEIVFARTGGELIDFDIALSINDKGHSEQTIRTVVGKPLELAIKPDALVRSVHGYFILKTPRVRAVSQNTPNQESGLNLALKNLTESTILANPVFAETVKGPVVLEKKFVLSEFEYWDDDKDGIYTATVDTPVVDGEYEIITMLEFVDPDLGMKQVRLIAVVDPEGYVYTTLPQGKLRISGSVVTLWWLNSSTKTYEVWPAKDYSQENPQITDDTGKYSFLVPPGIYYLKVEHPNYPIYQSKTFRVDQGAGVHMNIELKSQKWWGRIIDWKIIVIIIFAILLFYNFYHDRMLENLIKNRLNKN